MLIIGGGAFLGDLLTFILVDYKKSDIAIYSDIDVSYPSYLNDTGFLILKDEFEVVEYFKNIDNRFIIGIGNNEVRKRISKKYEALGGENISFISSKANIGEGAIIAPKGVIIVENVSVAYGSSIGEGCIIYMLSGIGHESTIGEYNMVSANVIMSKTTIGDFNEIGIGVKFVPGNTIGSYCKIGTGSIITKSFDDYSIIAGNPAKNIKHESKK